MLFVFTQWALSLLFYELCTYRTCAPNGRKLWNMSVCSMRLSCMQVQLQTNKLVKFPEGKGMDTIHKLLWEILFISISVFRCIWQFLNRCLWQLPIDSCYVKQHDRFARAVEESNCSNGVDYSNWWSFYVVIRKNIPSCVFLFLIFLPEGGDKSFKNKGQNMKNSELKVTDLLRNSEVHF